MPTPDHVVVVFFENKSYGHIVGNTTDAPYINSLMNDPYAATFTSSYAITHPSQPNYLHIFSGSDQGVTDSSIPSGLPFSTANLGASLIAGGKTFTGYAEDLPYAGYDDAAQVGYYVRKHNPWVNWQDSGTNGIPSSLNQPFSSFPTDYSTLPTVSFVVPNNLNIMHPQNTGGETLSSMITIGDTWLQTNLDGYIQWAKTNNSLLIITFDEDNYDADPQHIVSIFIGSMVIGGVTTESISHHNVLRTLEDMYGLAYAGNSANVSPIVSIWSTPLPIELSSFTASLEYEGVQLRWTTASEKNNDHFTIERSGEKSFVFHEVAKIKGEGNSTQPKNYTHLDVAPYIGKTIYRLKQTDFDGKVTYSKSIAVSLASEKPPLATVEPNPSDGSKLQVRLENIRSGMVFISIYNSSGQVILTRAAEATGQKSSYLSIIPDIALPPGIYVLTVHCSDGAVNDKFVVK